MCEKSYVYKLNTKYPPLKLTREDLQLCLANFFQKRLIRKTILSNEMGYT